MKIWRVIREIRNPKEIGLKSKHLRRKGTYHSILENYL
jgi:hypothetical protein